MAEENPLIADGNDVVVEGARVDRGKLPPGENRERGQRETDREKCAADPDQRDQRRRDENRGASGAGAPLPRGVARERGHEFCRRKML